MGTIHVTPAEALRLAKINEAQLAAAAARAQSNAYQATADRFRLEGDEPQAEAFEQSCDGALKIAREHHERYQRLTLGQDV